MLLLSVIYVCLAPSGAYALNGSGHDDCCIVHVRGTEAATSLPPHQPHPHSPAHMRNPNIPLSVCTVTPQRTCTLATPIPSLSCEASPYRYISRAVFVSFMFPEGLITESARNVLFHLLLLLFSHSTTAVCTRMASSKPPLPQRTPHARRSRRLRGQELRRSRARREWSGAPFLTPSGGPSPLTGRTPTLAEDGLRQPPGPDPVHSSSDISHRVDA